jgi:hypothetical protein
MFNDVKVSVPLDLRIGISREFIVPVVGGKLSAGWDNLVKSVAYSKRSPTADDVTNFFTLSGSDGYV